MTLEIRGGKKSANSPLLDPETGSTRKYNPQVDTIDELVAGALDVWNAVGYDIIAGSYDEETNVEDPRNPAFLNYIGDMMSDVGVPTDVNDRVKQRLSKGQLRRMGESKTLEEATADGASAVSRSYGSKDREHDILCDECGNRACRHCDTCHNCDAHWGEIDEITPPGYEKVVKALKKSPDVDNPWAVAWSMKKKGARVQKRTQ